MNSKTVLLMDIGGSNCRAKIVRGVDGLSAKESVIVSRADKVSDKQAFILFIEQLLGTGSYAIEPDFAILCFAGPVIGESVSMVNWSGQRTITISELIHAGLPEKGITLLNDMEAAAYALIARREGSARFDEIILFPGSNEGSPRNFNSVMLIPGTGIGVAALVGSDNTLHDVLPQVMGCEMQHTPIPVLNEEQEIVLNNMRVRLSITQPSWEDFISGRGLENIYNCLIDEEYVFLGAEEIARRAIQEKNSDCMAALDMFYQCCGALAQVLALTFQPYGGIFLAGESTRRNISFIQHSSFLGYLHDNEVRADLLKQFPVYLVRNELNLEGAAFVADRLISRI